MEFEKRKALQLAAMATPERDKSPKGTVDAPIVPLLDSLNRHPSFFTTSSCSGRISILVHPPPQLEAASTSQDVVGMNEEDEREEEKKKRKKKSGGGSWLLVTHELADPKSIVDLLFRSDTAHGRAARGTVVFRFEPFILAVECKDTVAAQMLVSTAIGCGFRESGITSLQKRIMVAIRCSIRLEVPLGEVGKMMVPPEYIMYLVNNANEKMKANRKRTDCFLQALQYEGTFRWAADADKNKKEVNKDDRIDLSVAEVKHIEKPDNDAETCSGLHESDDTSKNDALISSKKNSNHSRKLEDNSMGGTGSGFRSRLPTAPGVMLSVKLMVVVGEPIENLFIWGHSACAFGESKQRQILVFGGFGGLGRHARRNGTLLLNPQSGLLREINTQGPPCPRLGHTSSIIGRNVYVIGGRGDPMQIFNDVWALDTVENKWVQFECSGSFFPGRHRHAASVVDSNIFVFGGLCNEVIYSCMHVLDPLTMRWNEVEKCGECPCARHSHALVANGFQLFMFGGYDGQKALCDLYTFDTRNLKWKILRTTGRSPSPRFSHSMFVYTDYLGIIGGCPVRPHYQEMALLHLEHKVWKYIMIDYLDKGLWVRSSTNIVENDLIIVGGGASCYAFGTKFNHPVKISLGSLLIGDKADDASAVEYDGATNSYSETSERKLWHMKLSDNHSDNSGLVKGAKLQYIGHSDTNSVIFLNQIFSGDMHLEPKKAVLQLEKKYGKLGKDMLKKFGLLDVERKVGPSGDGLHILLPISDVFFKKLAKVANSLDSSDGYMLLESFKERGFPLDEVCLRRALNILLACGALVLNDNKACRRKIHTCPQKILKDAVSSLMQSKGLPLELLGQVPARLVLLYCKDGSILEIL